MARDGGIGGLRLGLLSVVCCGALMTACSSSSGATSSAGSRCGASYVTSVEWVGGPVGSYEDPYWGGEYDPGDDYDPSVDDGYTGDDDGYTGDDDGYTGDDDGYTGDDDGSSDDGSSDDGSGDDGSGDDGDVSGESLSAIGGCWTCQVGCTPAGGGPGRQALGASDSSYDDACHAGVASLARWSHHELRQKLIACKQLDLPARTPASPTVAVSKHARVAHWPRTTRVLPAK
jgi:hypothetical protein